MPVATQNNLGVVKIKDNLGIKFDSDNQTLRINPAITSTIKDGTHSDRPLVPYYQQYAVFYGLSKAAGVNLQNETVTFGTYPDSAKIAINNMLGSVSKDSLDNAGITGRTYTTKFGGEFTVTTATTSGWNSPYKRASVTGRISKEYMHRVTVNGTEYILQTRMWYNASVGNIKVYEYLGNLGLYVSDTILL